MSLPPAKPFPEPVLVTDSTVLRAACERLGAEQFVTVDTEFMREKTYWPVLCVAQLASDTEVLVVDALAPGLDLGPLGTLMAKQDCVKVFHAARQDAEIFLRLFDVLPTPLFDTQVAAMVAGFGDQVGYDSLIASTTGGQIDKAHRFSDWSVRPLSSAQIAYAAADVTHLRGAYRILRTKIEREGRIEWVKDEMNALADARTFRPDPDMLWERLKPRTGNRRMLGLLRAIAAWREREAQRIDVPRQRVLRDESLLEIAATAPTTAEALARIRSVGRGLAEGRNGASLLAAIAEAAGLPIEAMPLATERRSPVRPSAALISLLKVLLAAKSEEYGVAPRLIASSDDLDRIATEDEPDVPAATGWRREVFGADAASLRAGTLALGVSGRKVTLLRS